MFAEESFIKKNNSIEKIRDEVWIKQRHPYVGGFEITPYCNLHCVHCYLQDKEKEKLLSTDQVKFIVDKLYNAGVLFLYFTGGEIFTRKDFLDIYIYAKKKGFIIELLTNGTLITENVIDVFNKYPPASVSISMYGKNDESYYNVTGKRGMYDKVINTFDILYKNDIHFEIKYIAMKENKDDFFEIRSMAEKYGAQFSYAMELFPTLNGNSCTKNHMLAISEIIDIEKKIPGKKEEYRKAAQLENPFYGKKDIPLYLCDMAKSNFLIDYKGYLNPCHKCRFVECNLLEWEFEDAWNYYGKKLKEKADINNKCLSCKNIMMCSPCVMVNYLSTGDYNKVPDTVCSLTKARIQMANE